MPRFSKEDFTPENATRLSVIIMPRMGKNPLASFRDMNPTTQKKFNRLMNEYIATLGEDWEETLLADFNQIVNEDILNEDFDAAKQIVPELNTDSALLLSEEQREFFAEHPEEMNKITGKA
jgi:hypothetical protein